MSLSPSIAVIVAVRNAAATLEQCLDSVLGQTWSARELIVIDGASTDGSRELLERRAQRLAYWVSEPDGGIYHAWNKGLARARSDWICFLGADDYLWEPQTLERIAPLLAKAYPPARVVYGQVAVINSAGGPMQLAGRPWPEVRRLLPQIMCLPHTALMHHRSLFEQHGGFDESFRIGGDYELLLRELRSGSAQFADGHVLAAMRHGGVSSDPAMSLEMLREFRRAQRKHGLRAGGAWTAAFLKAHLRVRLWRLLGPRAASRVFDGLRLLQGKDAYWTRQ